MEDSIRTKNILEYLYKLEYYSPFMPNGEFIFDSKEKKMLTHQIFSEHKSTNDQYISVFVFYVGILDYQNALYKINQMVGFRERYKEFGKTESTIFGFKITEEGEFLVNSFSLCHFVYAIHEIIKQRKADIDLDEIKFCKLLNKIISESEICEFDFLNPRESIIKLCQVLKNVFYLLHTDIKLDIKITVEHIYRKRLEKADTPAILSSFYTSDLSMIKEIFDSKIEQYLSFKRESSIEIDKDVAKIKEVLHPKNYPLGKWPSRQHPSLMQQIAINIALAKEESIFSVNGPPGSGKTTLIKEIVADIVVKRAEVMASYLKPDDAFSNCSDYYKLDSKLSKFGILVASNNNNAVENISLELPIAKNVCESFTNLFDTTTPKEVYFTELMNYFTEFESWGLISVPLGKGENINKFNKSFFYPKEHPDVYYFLKNEKISFEEAKESFLKKLEEVKEYQNKLIQYYNYTEDKEMVLDAKRNGVVVWDDSFFKDIPANLDSQEKSPWTSLEYDRLREELFYESLQLHKSFIVHSNAFLRNMKLLSNCLLDRMSMDLHRKCYKDVLNTLFLMIPVVSTSLASVSKFLNHIPKDGIGYLIIDEAGQATPSSTIGAVYRAKNSIVLGDPFQIEPVSTIPSVMYKALDSKNLVPNYFKNESLSCQILADSINKYGSMRKNNTWVGCPLLLHRRCLNPMFAISNEIAYDNKMFYYTNDESDLENLSLEESVWYDISGDETILNSHYIFEQGEKVVELVQNAFYINQDLPDLFIISPFRTVVTEMRKVLKSSLPNLIHKEKQEIQSWVKEHCGTIHTFQGREANEVILLLGCSDDKLNAARWAGDKPNILNVAVTRAKYRIAIIGSSSLWKNINYFNVAYDFINS